MTASARSRRPGLALLTLCALGIGSGCQFNRTFFQMDSNSRSPFFGFDLLSSRSKSAPAGVNRYQSDPITPASRVDAPESPQADRARTAIRWPKPFGRSRQPLPLPLPISEAAETDVPSAPVEQFL